MAVTQDTAADTLALLEERLRHIAFLIEGASHEQDSNNTTTSAASRLRNLERQLKVLASKSYAIADLLQLHKQHPALFHPSDPHEVPSTLPPAGLAQLVLAHEQLYRSTATQLATLNENSAIPDPAALSKLIALQPRIDRIEAKQYQQAQEVAELRLRSMRVVATWHEKGVLQMGEKWAEWESELRDCEILVRRNEAAKIREEEMV
ncbi:hypothetical protein TI39_contig291g00030 [Zymoseptoria brevis]|uniref:Nuclear distribution protein RO10 n=1 Tax=Zymoseptoria brevis TaxID=1047168 RepID=A0A0F4GVK2_9PEZI|nr:hypothetical protein TI39_contig291g00030 [Zymoseptoria brevis]